MSLSILNGPGKQVLGKLTLMATKMSPEVLLATGIVGVVGAAVLASRATLRTEDTLTEMRESVATINETREIFLKLQSEGVDIPKERHYEEKTYKRDLFLTYTTSSLAIVKEYMPAIIVGTISIAAITGSHIILKNRNIALMAAYEAVNRSYNAYRGRVQETLGEEKDLEFVTGAKKVEVIEHEDSGAKTNKMTFKEDVELSRDGLPSHCSPYARWWDKDTTEEWTRNQDYNLSKLTATQSMMNMKLQTKGYVFLNEVYEALGLAATKPGAVVGWVLSANNDTDNFVDFGIFDINNKHAVNQNDYMSMNGAYLLDFNVDGVILDRAFPKP